MQSGSLPARAVGWFRKTLLQRLGSEWIINRKLKQGPYYRPLGLDLKMLKKNPHGIDLGPMQPCLPERLFTQDETIRLAPDEFIAEMEKAAAFLAMDEVVIKPPEFDLQLIGRRDPRTNNSWMHNSYRMSKAKTAASHWFIRRMPMHVNSRTEIWHGSVQGSAASVSR